MDAGKTRKKHEYQTIRALSLQAFFHPPTQHAVLELSAPDQCLIVTVHSDNNVVVVVVVVGGGGGGGGVCCCCC